MTKLASLRDAVGELIPDGASVALGLQLEQMIPFAAAMKLFDRRSAASP